MVQRELHDEGVQPPQKHYSANYQLGTNDLQIVGVPSNWESTLSFREGGKVWAKVEGICLEGDNISLMEKTWGVYSPGIEDPNVWYPDPDLVTRILQVSEDTDLHEKLFQKTVRARWGAKHTPGNVIMDKYAAMIFEFTVLYDVFLNQFERDTIH